MNQVSPANRARAAGVTDTALASESLVAQLALTPALAAHGIRRIFAVTTPLRLRFRGIDHREALLLEGPAGWGECSPFWDYDPEVASRWLRAAIATATQPLPRPLPGRDNIDVNITVPVIPAAAARARVLAAGCHTAKVKVAGAGTTLAADCDRIAAVREALEELYQRGVIALPGRIRVDANAAWDVEEAQQAITAYDRAAGVRGLDYVEQPCADVHDLARLRRLVRARIAADEALRLSADPLQVKRLAAADVAVLKVQPLAGSQRVLDLAAELDLPTVISSALDFGVGIFAAAATAAALPQLAGACGLGTVNLFAADVCTPRVEAHAGQLHVGAHPDDNRPTLDFANFTPVAATSAWVKRWENRLKAMLEYV